MGIQRAQESVCFELRDGIYWLQGRDAQVLADRLQVPFEGRCLGFDRETALAQMCLLLKRNMRVMCREGDVMRAITLRPRKPCRMPVFTEIWLSPSVLVGSQYLGDLALRRLAQSPAGLAEEPPEPIYVYAIGSDWYEVDWELTCTSEKRFLAAALAAHRSGSKLACRLVLPKPKRGRSHEPKQALVLGAAVAFGQLRFPL